MDGRRRIQGTVDSRARVGGRWVKRQNGEEKNQGSWHSQEHLARDA